MPFTNTLDSRTATIASGASLSDAVRLHDKALVLILMPAAWTAAVLSFQISYDTVTFYDLYDKAGNEYTVEAAAAAAIIIPAADFPGVASLKVRSGTTGSAVNQADDRDLILVIRGLS